MCFNFFAKIQQKVELSNKILNFFTVFNRKLYFYLKITKCSKSSFKMFKVRYRVQFKGRSLHSLQFRGEV